MVPDYTIVCGVDKYHLQQLEATSQTWWKNKPDLLNYPMVIFYDTAEVSPRDVRSKILHPDLSIIAWPYPGTDYAIKGDDRFYKPQRYKMLAGFLYVPVIINIQTPYWLKLDTDVVASGEPDWIDPEWFAESPAIISHPWSFTRPADQMIQLDTWVEDNFKQLPASLRTRPPLELSPKPGWGRIKHKRITSWCSFNRTEFTRYCAGIANLDGRFGMPVPSQDGFVWYVAKRMGLPIRRASMKRRGWEQWHTKKNVFNAVERIMKGT